MFCYYSHIQNHDTLTDKSHHSHAMPCLLCKQDTAVYHQLIMSIEVHLHLGENWNCQVYINNYTWVYQSYFRDAATRIFKHHHHQPINIPKLGQVSTRRTGHNPPRGPISDSWVLTTAKTAGINGLTCLP
jgi:hypothetical protein